MRKRMQSSDAILLSLLVLVSFIGLTIAHGDGDMNIELVHRHDARLAGVVKNHNASMDQTEAVKGFIERDAIRHKAKRHSDAPIPELEMHSGLDYGLGEYFVQVGFGTPEQRFWVVADTGNDFTWVNCIDRSAKKRAHRHHKRSQHHHHHHHHSKKRSSKGKKRSSKSDRCKGVFCPQRSKTFETVSCSSEQCQDRLSPFFTLTECPTPNSPCLYNFSYVDGSFAAGFFGTETISLDLANGKKGRVPDLTVGCTRAIRNAVTFDEYTGGVLGLGYARDSFVDKAALQYGGIFSYCLVDHLSTRDVSSYFTFGKQDVPLYANISSTELVVYPPTYGVVVEAVSIGGQVLSIPPKVWEYNSKGQGGTIIDTGTTLTYLVPGAYEPVIEALTNALSDVPKIHLDNMGVLEHCYDGDAIDESKVPELVFHFLGGALFAPPVKSYIIDVAPKVKCIGIILKTSSPSNPPQTIIGNIMQQNFYWEFNLPNNTLDFAPAECY